MGCTNRGGQTDQALFFQTKTIPIALTLNPQGDAFAILSVPGLALTTFNFSTGKRHRQYDESVAAISEMQQAAAGEAKLDSMEFGRRLAVERELERQALEGVKEGRIGTVGMGTPAWDESGKMVMYATLLGIKVVNTVTNKVVRMLGKDETIRFLNLALYQGLPIKKGFTTIVSQLGRSVQRSLQREADPGLWMLGHGDEREPAPGRQGRA